MCSSPYQNKQPTQRAPKFGARLAHMLALTMPRLVLAPGHVSKLFGWCCFGYSSPNGAAISHQFAPPHCKNVQCAHAPQMPQAHAGWAGNWPSARAPPQGNTSTRFGCAWVGPWNGGYPLMGKPSMCNLSGCNLWASVYMCLYKCLQPPVVVQPTNGGMKKNWFGGGRAVASNCSGHLGRGPGLATT